MDQTLLHCRNRRFAALHALLTGQFLRDARRAAAAEIPATLPGQRRC
jgi:hypothetical protein